MTSSLLGDHGGSAFQNLFGYDSLTNIGNGIIGYVSEFLKVVIGNQIN